MYIMGMSFYTHLNKQILLTPCTSPLFFITNKAVNIYIDPFVHLLSPPWWIGLLEIIIPFIKDSLYVSIQPAKPNEFDTPAFKQEFWI